MESETSSPLSLPTTPRRRRIAPLLIWAGGAIAIACIQLWPSLEGNFRGPLTALAILLMLIGRSLWILLFSGLPLTRRLAIVGIGAGLLIAIIVAGRLTLRREGSYTGAGWPRFVWKWSPHDVAPAIEKIAPPAGQVDLAQTTPDDFPQFLGPDRDNQVHNAALARDWATHPPVELWRRKVGAGWSGFSVVGNYAITMEQREQPDTHEPRETTICYNLLTGQPIWAHGNNVYLREAEGGDGPRCTPTISDGRVYTFGGLGNLDCLDGSTGEAIWSKTLFTDADRERLRYGQTCSPLIEGEQVIVTGGHLGPALQAFDKKTGAPLWKSPRDLPGDPAGEQPSDYAGYASPSVVTLNGVRQLVQVHQFSIAGHDLSDGRILWFHKWPGFLPKVSQAIAIGADRVYCSTGYGIGSVLLQISRKDQGFQAGVIWENPVMKTEFSNVIIRDGLVYGLDDGRLTCQDLATGQKKWRGPRYGHGQILQAGPLLLVQSEHGAITLLDAQPAGPAVLGSFQALTEGLCWNTMALAGHVLLVRNAEEAACYRLP